MTRRSSNYVDEITRAVDQVCSSTYIQMFEKIAKEQPYHLTHDQYTLLSYYPNEITWYQGEQRHGIIERIRRTHLTWFVTWLQKQDINLYREWNYIMDDLMLHMTNLFFRIDRGDVITSEHTRQAFYQVTHTIKHMLSCIVGSMPDVIKQSAGPTVQILLLILFYFTWDEDLVIYLKNLQLVELLTELIRTSNGDNEIQLQAYRILAVLMTEADLKEQGNIHTMVAVFITFIKEGIDGSIPYEARLHNSLRSLKVLIQHDQIREELIQQQGYSLLLRCALEEHFNSHKAKLPAFEILLALAFNEHFANTLRDNTVFMDHIRILTSSAHQDLQRIATALVWKLEKTQYQLSATEEQKQYDVMISYSQSDKELCHRLLQALENDQLRVWIDTRSIHGTTFDSMAKATENAEFVFVCMSDAYKQNPFCEMEASYAVQRRCRIIPLVMKPNYKADGWLEVLTSASISIDFPTLGFERAYQELKKQMELIRTIIDTELKPISCKSSISDASSVGTYPHCIDTWTEEHVKSFLLDKELDVLIPVMERMNGRMVHQVYLMHRTNQQAMFLSLKEDVAKCNQQNLTLKDYFTFLNQIKLYIPYANENQLNSSSTVCCVM